MPIIIYTPDPDAAPERFEFQFDDLPFEEIVALEKQTGRNWGEVERLYWQDNLEVQGALLLGFLRRREPQLVMEQLALRPKQLRFELTPDEESRFVDGMLARPDLKEGAREILEARKAELPDPGPEVAEDPKA